MRSTDPEIYSSYLEQRRTQRYKLELPLRILQVGQEKTDQTEQTRDISSGGVCFVSDRHVDVGDRIEYVITLSGSNPPVRIRCLGKVLRTQTPPDGGPPEVAVTMERYAFVRAEEFAMVNATA